MNILSHYYAGRTGSFYYNFGLVLPDLIGTSNRGWKPNKLAAGNEEWYNDIIGGCKHHLQIDAIFHSLDEFKDNVSFIRKKFEQSSIKVQNMRLFFVAHILLELMLDRLILIYDVSQADSFYSGLEELDVDKIKIFLERNAIEDTTQFLSFFERFRTHRYIYHYIEDERMMFALNRISQRIGQPQIEENMLEEFSRILFEVQQHLSLQFFSIFEAVKF